MNYEELKPEVGIYRHTHDSNTTAPYGNDNNYRVAREFITKRRGHHHAFLARVGLITVASLALLTEMVLRSCGKLAAYFQSVWCCNCERGTDSSEHDGEGIRSMITTSWRSQPSWDCGRSRPSSSKPLRLKRTSASQHHDVAASTDVLVTLVDGVYGSGSLQPYPRLPRMWTP